MNLAEPLLAALNQLKQAHDYAADIECDPWEFAVEIDRLIEQGITIGDLRWFVKKGFLEHACDVTSSEDLTRKFERRPNLAFTHETCFLLTESGLELFESQNIALETPAVPTTPLRPEGAPFWDADDRTLYVGPTVVKEYRVPSPNQEAVLSAFQEEHWPRYIDDPLSPVGDQNPKQRLRDTIKYLNANQKNQLIRFRGDGTGERVRWELVDKPTPQP